MKKEYEDAVGLGISILGIVALLLVLTGHALWKAGIISWHP